MPLQARRQRLVEPPVQSDEVPARAERQPVQVDRRHSRSVRCPARMADFALAEDFLPVYDVSDAVATAADADRETAWRALLDVDLLKLGRDLPSIPMYEGGWILLGERP